MCQDGWTEGVIVHLSLLIRNRSPEFDRPLSQYLRQLKMPGIDWRESQGHVQAIGGEAATEGDDWRCQLPSGSRYTIVNKLIETLKKHLPLSGEEGLQDLEETAVRVEESIFTTATSQSDYIRRISLKMLVIKRKSRKPSVFSLQTIAASTSRNSRDPAADVGMESNDWRSQLLPLSRTRITNKIVETLRRHLHAGPEAELELERIALRFEENIYSSATSQSDYLRKISLKILTMETRSHSQGPVSNSRLS